MKTSELDRLLTPAKRAVYDGNYDAAFRQLFTIIEKLVKENESLRKKLEALSGQGLKDKLKDILHNIETLETEGDR